MFAYFNNKLLYSILLYLLFNIFYILYHKSQNKNSYNCKTCIIIKLIKFSSFYHISRNFVGNINSICKRLCSANTTDGSSLKELYLQLTINNFLLQIYLLLILYIKQKKNRTLYSLNLRCEEMSFNDIFFHAHLYARKMVSENRRQTWHVLSYKQSLYVLCSVWVV